MAVAIQHPAAIAPMPAVARILSQFDRDQLANFIEVAIGLIDLADGDPDEEEDNEDRCCARDDTGGKHPDDGYGDGLPGDPNDAEDCDPEEPWE